MQSQLVVHRRLDNAGIMMYPVSMQKNPKGTPLAHPQEHDALQLTGTYKKAATISGAVFGICAVALNTFGSDAADNPLYGVAGLLGAVAFLGLLFSLIAFHVATSYPESRDSFGKKLLRVIGKSFLYVILPGIILTAVLMTTLHLTGVAKY